MRRQATVLVAFVTFVGCERPAAEPDPPSPKQTSGASVAASSAVASAPKPRAKSNCIVPLPDKPERPAVSGAAANCPQDPTGRMQLRRMPLTFATASKTIDAEVAETDPERMRGLMYRTELNDDEGMIFIFKRASRHRFWMKNTCLPLDMLFVDANGVIVGIEENVPTLNESSYFVRCASQYVIEVNAGWSRRHGVKPGDRVTIPSKP